MSKGVVHIMIGHGSESDDEDRVEKRDHMRASKTEEVEKKGGYPLANPRAVKRAARALKRSSKRHHKRKMMRE